MPLSWNEIRDRSIAFSRSWADVESERAEAQSFWNEFFEVFGIPRRRVASFEEPVKKLGEKRGRIDAYWKGMLVVEHKSRGESLERAFQQALDYFPGIPDRDLPKYVIVSDFAHFRLYDLDAGIEFEFALKDLQKKIKLFGFIAGYAPQEIKPQDPVNIKAAEQMGRLHDLLKASGYTGHALEVVLVRLVFCLFADDTGIFPMQSFRDWVEARTSEDGSDLGPHLAELFQVLNTHRDKRQKNLDEQLNAFDYINGKLFEEPLPLAAFDAKMRATLLDCCALNWGAVSPAIFGAMFQAVMDEKARRSLGAHYTSEENILKLIKPLFLDELWAEFEKVKSNKNRLFDFLKKLRNLTFLDPACGCGNFLVVTYRELRKLELEVLRTAVGSGQKFVDVFGLVHIDVDQFYGIEIDEWPAQIAQVAMWLVDHQMNTLVSEEFGMYFARIPLTSTPHIVQGNALQIDWNDVVPSERLSYIISNPPFVGAKFLSDEQRSDAAAVFRGIDGGGLLDFVAAWYVKAVPYISGSSIKCAFVSTNSIVQGEQVGVLWGWLLAHDMHIHFAHRTFQWSNEARGQAAVHCVIIGFAAFDAIHKYLFEYDDIRGEPHPVKVANINPYLVDAPDVVLQRRSHPICNVPEIGIGNKPIDDGNYLFTLEGKRTFLKAEPAAEKYFRRWIGAVEFLNGYERWCLWLGDCPPSELAHMPEAKKRVEAVRQSRLSSKSAPTRALATTPTRFHVENMPENPYLVIPEVSSERRPFIPIGYELPTTFASNLVKIVADAKLFHFGILSSTMHNAWMRQVGGRLKSDYRYSKDIVYNNFPWPAQLSNEHCKAIEAAGQGVLDARRAAMKGDPAATLAVLYNPETMPPSLVKAHQTLDRAVRRLCARWRQTQVGERC